jgi:uncharacterized peroxidase-related enzyme
MGSRHEAGRSEGTLATERIRPRFSPHFLDPGSGRGLRAWAVRSIIALLVLAFVPMAASHRRAAPTRAGAAIEMAAAPLPALNTRRPTFVLFQSSTSSVEREFLEGLRREGPARRREDVRVVLLNNLESPTAHRFRIRETPTLLALEPGGHEISRRTGPQAISAALAATAPSKPGAMSTASAGTSCRVWRGPRLRWVEESDPQARRVYRRFGGGRWGVPDIFKAMSLRPELMEKALDLSETGHFTDGYLDRRTKERIATFVSSLNGSPYCVGSHAGGLQGLGARSAEVAALARGDLEAASLAPRERALLEFVRRLTLTPSDVRDDDVRRLRAKGWRDEQIFEAAFDASLFAFFNRLAATYGLDSPPDGWKPPSP